VTIDYAQTKEEVDGGVAVARKPSPHADASSRLARLRDEPSAQVVIIGGGINGLATFRDLALQGVSVVLVEKQDFCQGSSAASSHMVHGGVRYLENGELRLVKESLQERNRLLENAPHYVRPLVTTIPIFSALSGLLSAPLRLLTHRPGRPKERGAVLIKVGLMLYDLFGRAGGSLPRHKFLGRRKSLAELPLMNSQVAYTATYYDAAMEHPERLALDVLRDGREASPEARAYNYVRAVGFRDGRVLLVDEFSGEEFTITADVVVNTTGPWTDITNRSLGIDSSWLGGTKGSHIVLDNPELLLACDNREIFFENSDGRIVLMYPLSGLVLVGTTDIPVDSPEEAICTPEEVDYFFDLIARIFPTIAINHGDIVYRYAGVRPLPASGDLSPGFVSRDYRIEKSLLGSTPVLSLVGGKWTTFRALGEHMADEVLALLGITRKQSTKTLAIGGGRGFPTTPDARSTWVDTHRGVLSMDRVDLLLKRYGTYAHVVMDSLEKYGDEPLVHQPDFSVGELHHFVRSEYVLTLSDVVHRRTRLAFTGALTPPLLAEIADHLQPLLGWGEKEKNRQIRSITVEKHSPSEAE
jgi:glycerol-3-phosphate dehydrogenase